MIPDLIRSLRKAPFCGALLFAALAVPAFAHADAAADIRAAQESIAAGAQARDLNQIMSNYWHSPKLFVFDVYPPRVYSDGTPSARTGRTFSPPTKARSPTRCRICTSTPTGPTATST